MVDPKKRLEPCGNRPEQSVAGGRMVWWAFALVAMLLFCLLAWWMHGRGSF